MKVRCKPAAVGWFREMEKIEDRKTRQKEEDFKLFGSLGEAGHFMCDDLLANIGKIPLVCQ